MNLFHKVVYKVISVTMPDYLTLYSRYSRLRSPHVVKSFILRLLMLVVVEAISDTKEILSRYPFDIINSMRPPQFKINKISIFGI